MSAVPSRRHQEIQVELLRQISNYLIGKTCRVYGSPFDVRFAEKDELDNKIKDVVQPDITVISDRSKLEDRGCLGSPDLIIEIVSPSTASIDYIKKLSLYEKNMVKEYWIVDTEKKEVYVYSFEKKKGEYNIGNYESYAGNAVVRSKVFTGMAINMEEIFSG
jgi:Uma2 family endonuclease